MTPEFVRLVERHVVSPETHDAITAWLTQAAQEATTEQGAAFWVTLRREVAEPTPVGPVSEVFVDLALALDAHEVTAIVGLGDAGLAGPPWMQDVTRAGIAELVAARALTDGVDEAFAA